MPTPLLHHGITAASLRRAAQATWTVTGNPIYIAPSGSDTTGNGTIGAPWATWTKGLTQLRAAGPGYTLVMRAGTYTEAFNSAGNTPQGTSGSRCRVMGYPGETAVIKGIQRLYDPNYTTFDHFIIESGAEAPAQHTFRITGGVGWVIEYCESRNTGSFADVHVTTFQTTNRPSGAVIRYNDFHGQQVDLGPSGTNVLPNKNQHHIYASCDPTGDLTITRNLFRGGRNVGGAVKLGATGITTYNVAITYNSFYDNRPHSVLLEGNANNVLWDHNISDLPGTSHLDLWDAAGNVATSFRNNVYWDVSSLTLVSYGGTTTISDRDAILAAGGNTKIDPQFVNAASGDLHTQNASATTYGRYAP